MGVSVFVRMSIANSFHDVLRHQCVCCYIVLSVTEDPQYAGTNESTLRMILWYYLILMITCSDRYTYNKWKDAQRSTINPLS